MKFRFLLTRLLVRPYVRHELPGWGKIYELIIGSYRKDAQWRDIPIQRITGKLHGFLLDLDIGGWSNRATWALGRFYDLGTQLIVGGLLRPGDLFVDIGANEGMISLVAARSVGDTGRVIAFEPNPIPRQKFESTVKLNEILNVEIIAAGASNKSGALQLFVPDINTGEGSFALSSNENRSGQTIDCPVLVADEVLKDLNPSLIKIDVEGFELNVIEGLKKTISTNKPIIVLEMVESHIERAGSKISELSENLSDMGYFGFRISMTGLLRKSLKLSPISTDKWIDADVLWIPEEGVEDVLKRISGYSQHDLKTKLVPIK